MKVDVVTFRGRPPNSPEHYSVHTSTHTIGQTQQQDRSPTQSACYLWKIWPPISKRLQVDGAGHSRRNRSWFLFRYLSPYSQKVIWMLGWACLLSGCAFAPNKVEQRASAYIGRSVDSAISAFGQPTSRLPRDGDIDGGSGWQYVWNNTFEGAGQRFVQTGEEHTGTSMIGMTQGGNGIAPMPVYQNNYRPTGYYENDLHGCMLFIDVDRNGIVEKVGAMGDKC